MGEHDPESAQDERTSSKMWSPAFVHKSEYAGFKRMALQPSFKVRNLTSAAFV